MEPGSRVELPPRGADLSFLSNDPNQDTPSKWLTFNSTPNGNTTPGTAFGSPFWSSLAGATAQASTSAGGARTGNISGSASGGHGQGQGRQHSPSREFNPFELSFFPEHNEHLLNKASGKEGTSVKGEKDGASDAKNHLSSSVSSLKRPFSDAEPQQTGSDELASRTSVKKQKLVEDASQGASDLGVDFNAVLASTSGGGNTTNSSASNSEGSAYAPSPSLNLNTSPDSGSPASSMIPTPNLQSALLPPNTNLFGNSVPVLINRKDSTPPDLAEAAKLNNNGFTAASQVHIVQAPLQQQQVQYQPQQQQQGYSYFNQQQPQPQQQNFLPPINVNYGYPPYMPQQQSQQAQPQPQQQPQRMASPAQSGPARRQSGDTYTQQQQSPVINSNAIPYANGRGPASAPSGGNLRSGNNDNSGNGGTSTSGRPSRASARTGGGRNSTSAIASAVKIEELDSNDFMSGNGNGRSYSPAVSDSATNTSNKGGSRKGGNKKTQQQQQQGQQAQTSGSGHVSFNANAQGQSSSGMNGLEGTGNGEEGEEDEDEDDEHKRKAFLERNRQAACRSRQKKKEWINNLETHAARLQSENQHLSTEIESMRKELFALRHTLQFHERCGCAANPAGQPLSTATATAATAAPVPAAAQAQPQQQQPAQQPPASIQQQQQQPAQIQQSSNSNKPVWQRPLPPSQQSSGVQAQSPARAPTPAQQAQAQSQAQGIPLAQSQNFPPQMASMQRPPAHVQTQPQPLSGGNNQRLGNSATMGKGATTLAPSALQGMPPFQQQQQQQGLHPHMQSLPSKAQQAAPPNINLSASSLEPNAQTRNHHLPSHGLGGNHGGLGTSSDITRPGSAGARFGLATPNFSDLFNGAMGKFGNSGTTPGFGSGLLFTPGGIMSSGNTASHFSSYNATNAGLPNTFGLSLQDIPIRPASAPPTPSPAVDSHSLAIPQDYFSSKKPSAMLSTPSGFADFLASWPIAQNCGSVLA